ncbi:carboxylating nicotinate-nucleotide diphosphorylase [Fulvivirga lutea]|uniref:Probable nicotinate-nucleotide pyrophosphorylase [carboxylating] n=1 Tax=Fulvivirga lutea TaxID=2810512 RepID=A0A974WHQ4_9BACT|nr:carboxylating nicotinate-nucleotide diphosphorylase [Fulvivirga lutea]QSE98596.1 carboxylating nicotinate-nucleotide diphosphorylase [Fulvivirga lutea]
MSLAYLSDKSIKQFIKSALAEDIGDGDHSSLSSIPQKHKSRARLLVKDDGILAGVDLAHKIFKEVDPELELNILMKDGDTMQSGDIAFEVSGSARSILTAERLVLNCMQRMSGIATYTHHMCSLIKSTKAKILDTRKTTPNFRIAEKWAVAIGGGKNHRFGLYDMIMLKDNHIDYAGSITKAVQSTQKYLKEKGKQLAIEVETRNLDEVKEALSVGGVDVIMLDNMMPSTMREAVKLINGQCKIEASGGITEMNIAEVAECGVDFISIGALTHSVKSKDLSLKAF